MLEYSKRNSDLTVKPADMTIYKMQSEVSKTLAHPLRIAILHYLKDGEKSVSQLVETLGASQSNISQHLSLLRQREIVNTRKEGSNIYYRVSSPKISQACDKIFEVLLEQLCRTQEMAKTYFQK
jgi:DNA-binding transcriptional ArsR family regulator